MMEDGERGSDAEGVSAIDAALARAIVDDAVGRYIAERRARIDAFIDRNCSLAGSFSLHRKAAGWDIVRAPLNLALALPQVVLKLWALVARLVGWVRLSDRLDGIHLFLGSDVAREFEWRLYTELLELPVQQGRRAYHRDALAEQIAADPRLSGPSGVASAALPSAGPRLGDWLTRSVGTYTGSRVAAGEIANAIIAIGAGAVAFQQATPGMLTLGPMLAQTVAQETAVASFPLGSTLGGLWYGVVPAAASVGLVAGTTVGMLLLASVLAAFSGMLTDPVQRRFGLHRRRLNRLIDALERELRGGADSRYAVRDLYVARVFDVVDWLRAALGAVR